jgi:hypothetical protein
MTPRPAAIPPEYEADVQAVIELWEPLAAFAWEQQLAFGRGVVVIEQDELNAARAARLGGSPHQPVIGYVPVTSIPPGDDFRRVVAGYEPERQIAIVIRPRGGDVEGADDRLYVLEAADHGRPSPRECCLRATDDPPLQA